MVLSHTREGAIAPAKATSIKNIEVVPQCFHVFRQIAAWPARQAPPFQSNKTLVQISK